MQLVYQTECDQSTFLYSYVVTMMCAAFMHSMNIAVDYYISNCIWSRKLTKKPFTICIRSWSKNPARKLFLICVYGRVHTNGHTGLTKHLLWYTFIRVNLIMDSQTKFHARMLCMSISMNWLLPCFPCHHLGVCRYASASYDIKQKANVLFELFVVLYI